MALVIIIVYSRYLKGSWPHLIAAKLLLTILQGLLEKKLSRQMNLSVRYNLRRKSINRTRGGGAHQRKNLLSVTISIYLTMTPSKWFNHNPLVSFLTNQIINSFVEIIFFFFWYAILRVLRLYLILIGLQSENLKGRKLSKSNYFFVFSFSLQLYFT